MIDNKDISNIRRDFKLKELSKQGVLPNPFEQFSLWLNDALNSDIVDPNAMTIATVNKESRPATRTVLLKDIKPFGFVFYSNYNSKKGTDLSNNNSISANFYWKELERQITINGKVELVSQEDSDRYFDSRPYESKISAIVSPQSTEIPNRKYLEELFNNFRNANPEDNIKRPSYWGGYIIIPDYFEFWQGRENRLHDRICYVLDNDNKWIIKRIAP